MIARDEFESRYEIRTLEPHHAPWTTAIVLHSNLCCGPVWSALYGQNAIETLHKAWQGFLSIAEHSIALGHCLGAFDKQYRYKREESASEGGRLYWDLSDTNVDKDVLLEQMDFPLVSIAMSYDGFFPPGSAAQESVVSALPQFGSIKKFYEPRDPRDPDSFKAKVPGEWLIRNSTCTRLDHWGQGIMKTLAHECMFQAAKKGFRAIQMDCMSEAVAHVWTHPPYPFRSEIVVQFDTTEVEDVDADGNATKPFSEISGTCHRIICTLKETGEWKGE